MNKNEVYQKHRDYLFPNVANYYREPVIMESGRGQYLYDSEGNEYLDFFGGILTVSMGHCHPDINSRVVEQINRLQHTSTLYPTRPLVDLAEKLARITPGRLQKSFFTCSGTEADETAVLLAKVYTGRQEIIALRHSYSGRSLLAMSLTAHAPWRHGGTHFPGIKHAHNAYCYRCAFGLTYPSCDLRCAKDIEELILTETSGQIAAFLAEPIQGVGGFIVPPKEYFREAVAIVRKYGGLFICDEVQTAWGRTGDKMFGIEHWDVDPDIMTSAKGLANGVPIGWTIAAPEVADSFKGLSISTFGGNPVSCAAALATIELVEREDLARNAKVVGDYLWQGLLALQEEYPSMGDVRGMGLMQAIEFVSSGKVPDPQLVLALFEQTKKHGLLIGKGGLYGNVIRISPPLNITKGDVDEALRILRVSLEEITGTGRTGVKTG